jgi:hypothetical protein
MKYGIVETKGLHTFYSKEPRLLLRAGSRDARRKIAASGIPNGTNYCVIFST